MALDFMHGKGSGGGGGGASPPHVRGLEMGHQSGVHQGQLIRALYGPSKVICWTCVLRGMVVGMLSALYRSLLSAGFSADDLIKFGCEVNAEAITGAAQSLEINPETQPQVKPEGGL